MVDCLVEDICTTKKTGKGEGMGEGQRAKIAVKSYALLTLPLYKDIGDQRERN